MEIIDLPNEEFFQKDGGMKITSGHKIMKLNDGSIHKISIVNRLALNNINSAGENHETFPNGNEENFRNSINEDATDLTTETDSHSTQGAFAVTSVRDIFLL